MPDTEVLRFAAGEQWILLTLNRRHFIRLHEAFPDHAGILVCSVDADFVGQARRIDAAISHHVSLLGLLLRINRAG